MRNALILMLVLATVAMAQAPRSVTLTWEDTVNPPGTTYSIYRATGLCSGTPAFNKIAEGLTVKTYVDNTVTPGNYCYVATASLNGMESAQSNQALGAVQPKAPTGLSVQVN